MLKLLRYHRPEGPSAVFPPHQRVCAEPALGVWAPPLGTQIHLKAYLRAQCAQKCARERPKTQKSGPLGAQGCQKMQKLSQHGNKWEPKMCKKTRFRKKVRNVVWTYYLLYILTPGTLQKPHFFTPLSNKNEGLFRMVPRTPPRSCKMVPTGPKNGESGVPRDPQGCQRVSQCLLKCSKKTSKISIPLQECLRGCLGCPTAPKIHPFLTFPRPALPQVVGTFEPPLHSLLHPTHFIR